jgi:hypothetical protein
MHFVRNVTLVSLPVLLLFLPGCATQQAYSGPELPDNEIAIIEEGYMGAFEPRVVITEIDDIKRDRTAAYMSVKPGAHRLELNLVSCTGYPVIICTNLASKTLVLDAEAGQAYVVRGKFAAQKPVFWIEEEKSNRVVSGQIFQEDIGSAANANSSRVLNEADEAIPDDGDTAIEYYGEAQEEIGTGTFDLTGTYVSEITRGSGYWSLNLKSSSPEVKIQQTGNNVKGTFGKGSGNFDGIIAGDTITIEWHTARGNGKAKWTMIPESNQLVGSYSENGRWNLKKIQ